ncbi:MAG TPA: 16S rRNA (cytosine(1402)-N(4))-methyltransferase RsmH [Acidimicrobiia bacterium]|jgi:16S rRNA (cytosine1402-N4)-methyltransferase|nr:16S rRNA (cytosine(1402)-N(4))-methyltransferase RsmH [Acidimicrobiia bacterium]
MAQTTPPYHVPVMPSEVVELFAPLRRGVIVDATYGGGGHSAALLAAMPDIRILGLDRDLDATARVPVEPRVRLETANFGNLAAVLADPDVGAWIDEPGDHDSHGIGVAGLLFDFGVSSHQLDEAQRGFSYHGEGPLDMRMGPDADLTAADLVNSWDRDELARVIRRFGEEQFARRIADAIVRRRPIATTGELAAIVAGAVPAAARRRRHPARKTFQALRIAVNDELAAVEQGLEDAIASVRPQGRIVVIAYHSLEDRIVKQRFAAGAAGCECPPGLPVCVCEKAAELIRLTRKPLRPTEEEVRRNPRARSARLRAVERAAA